MKGLHTLLWREYRSSRGWAIGLIGSLGLWTWIVSMISNEGVENRLALRSLIITVAFAIGVIVLSFMVGRLHTEIKHDEHRTLLLSPIPGYLHIVSRLVFAVGVGLIYAIGLGTLTWWVFSQAGAHLGASSIMQLVAAFPAFGIVTLLMPTLAWVLLLVLFANAYRLSHLTWIAVIVMCAGTPVSLLYRGINGLDHHLPVWTTAPGITDLFNRLAGMPTQGEGSMLTMAVPGVVHYGDIVGAVLLTGLLVFLAARLWEEMEG
ncbi:MAG: hypothetical protein DRI37_08585 [Chloroflexi bacterium]|nr:MAG: hypothetical protein DRI37_08585 [Chloroflexota bacterium]